MEKEVVVATRFIAQARASKEALKSATLLKNLSLNALIFGQSGVGKKTLAKFITDSLIVDGENFNDLLHAVEKNRTLIITNFHKVQNYSLLKKSLDKYQTRVIATAKEQIDTNIINDFFSIKIDIPPLRDRNEDIIPLCEKFYNELKTFSEQLPNICFDTLNINLENNVHSLKKSLFLAVLAESLHEEDILFILEKHIDKKLRNKSDYKKLLYIFDVPVIKSALKRYKTLLKTSLKLGLNRNTLRKKMNELDKYLN